MLHLLVLLLTAPAALLADCDGIVEIESSDADHWQAKLLLVSDTNIKSWTVKITFDMEVDFIESAMAEVTGSGKAWTLTNKEWDGGLDAVPSASFSPVSPVLAALSAHKGKVHVILGCCTEPGTDKNCPINLTAQPDCQHTGWSSGPDTASLALKRLFKIKEILHYMPGLIAS